MYFEIFTLAWLHNVDAAGQVLPLGDLPKYLRGQLLHFINKLFVRLVLRTGEVEAGAELPLRTTED